MTEISELTTRLRELLALCNGRLPETWSRLDSDIIAGPDEAGIHVARTNFFQAAALIVESHNALPALLDHIESQDRRIVELEGMALPKKCPGCAVDVPVPLESHLPECSVRQWHEAMDGVEDSNDD